LGVDATVVAGLDADGLYGVWWYEGTDYEDVKHRVPVPVPHAGIPLGVVEEAREDIRYNERPRRKNGRVWELSGGLLRCGHCGRAMIGRTLTSYRKSGKKASYHSYICPRKSWEYGGACPNRQHRAEPLEERFTSIVGGILKDPAPILEDLDRRIAETRKMLRDPDTEVEGLRRQLDELFTAESGYLRQNATGWIDDERLAHELRRVADERADLEGLMNAALNRQHEIEALERDRAAIAEQEPGARDLEDYAPEERRAAYKKLRITARIWADGDLDVWGAYDRSIFFKLLGADKTEADRRRHELAVELFKAERAAGLVDDETYYAYYEEDIIPDRYYENARRMFNETAPTYSVYSTLRTPP
jgi:Recombinase zinc beta ribbon domain